MYIDEERFVRHPSTQPLVQHKWCEEQRTDNGRGQKAQAWPCLLKSCIHMTSRPVPKLELACACLFDMFVVRHELRLCIRSFDVISHARVCIVAHQAWRMRERWLRQRSFQDSSADAPRLRCDTKVIKCFREIEGGCESVTVSQKTLVEDSTKFLGSARPTFSAVCQGLCRMIDRQPAWKGDWTRPRH